MKWVGAAQGRRESVTTIEALTAIWRRVLRRPVIGVDDSFFELGGSLESADRMFAAIANGCGRDLPSAMIYQAPTIAALASVLEQPGLPPFSPVVKVKTGTAYPPILFGPGLAGRVQSFDLARNLQTEHPIYGLQARGIDGLEEPFDRIEDMATYYLESIRQLQPHGPYLWIGYSFGGLVAFEMAQRLSQAGEKVGLLALVDAYPHPRFLSRGQRLRLMVQRARRHIAAIRGSHVREAIFYVARGVAHRLHLIERSSDGRPLGKSPLSLARNTQRIKKKSYEALARYQPRFYAGKIKFVKSESDTYFPGDPVGVWGNLVEDFEVETVHGAHLDMMSTNIGEVADLLTRYIREAADQL